jgi:ubiquinone/menaquinone biosynthesis C-methylase UbiE
MSFWYQLKEIVPRTDISNLLDIGPGSTFLRDTLHTFRPELDYKSLDMAPDQEPDFLGSVTKIPLPDNTYDAVTAFQVLEHIQFSDFEVALEELKRVSKKYVFISLPHNVPSFDIQFKFPGLKRFQLAIKFPIGRTHVFHGQHYWEVGKKKYSAKLIKRILKQHFELLDEYVPFENQYHHFYILQKKT